MLISGKVPVQVARFLAGGNLVALEKNKPNCPPDIRPIAVGEAIRRLAGKCLCSMTKAKAHDFLAPFQLGVACQGGAEKIIHGLRSCVDEHWHEVDFAVLKIDLHNAFNRVSRQAVLNACACPSHLRAAPKVSMVLWATSRFVALFGYYFFRNRCTTR